MTEHQFWSLVSLKLSGDASLEELLELNNYLRDRPEMKLRAAMMENFWNAHACVTTEQRESAFEKHQLRISSL